MTRPRTIVLVDQSLGPWEQRPVFKTNVKSFVSLRRVQPPIALSDLRRLSALFPSPGFEFPLDPTYEPELKGRDLGMPPPDPENTRTFAVLQKYNRLNLLVTDGGVYGLLDLNVVRRIDASGTWLKF